MKTSEPHAVPFSAALRDDDAVREIGHRLLDALPTAARSQDILWALRNVSAYMIGKLAADHGAALAALEHDWTEALHLYIIGQEIEPTYNGAAETVH